MFNIGVGILRWRSVLLRYHFIENIIRDICLVAGNLAEKCA